MSLTWYRIALRVGEAPAALIAARGAHLGEALAAAMATSPRAWPVAAARMVEGEIPLGESVGRGGVVRLGEAPGAPAFRFPAGVLPGLDAPLAGAGRGWVRRPHPSLSVLEAQTDAAHLVDLFLGVIERMPAADNLEVRLLPHFEDAPATDVWLTSRVDGKRVLRLLDDLDDELLANGHVEVAVYLRAQRATLRLTEHKTVTWVSDDPGHDPHVARWLAELGVPAVERLVGLADVPHLHHRHPRGRGRRALAEHLYRQRLRRVDRVAAPSPSPAAPSPPGAR